jgi:endonuclease/exonuclease/phosphatase family metal-dependent hydrolase
LSREEIYHLHLTVGQSTADGAEYLMSKALLLLPLKWDVGELVILVRERPHDQSDTLASQMKVWGVIGLNPYGACEVKRSVDIRRNPQAGGEPSGDSGGAKVIAPRIETTYHFSETSGIWEPVRLSLLTENTVQPPSTLAVSSYNVLADSTFPPDRDRYALLTLTLLSEHALADIVVMQEVSDAFLSFLLAVDSVRSRWPFVTHGPPGQREIGPMPSLCNIVVLSRWNFRWEWFPFEQKHKGTAILVFENIRVPKRPTPRSTGAPSSSRDEGYSLPLVLAGVHLTSGLTDGAVAAKESQLYTLLNHLSKTYAENPWIVAGDFNVTTSAITIDAALRSKSISTETANTLSSLDTLLSKARLSDTWFMARTETLDATRSTTRLVNREDIQDGEEGATFNPLENALALKSSLSNRPQRYDRILIRGEDTLEVTEFGMFGFAEEGHEGGDIRAVDVDPQPRYGSDHWGIRTTLRIDPDLRAKKAADFEHKLISLNPIKAPKGLADITLLKSYLAEHAMLPTEEETDSRKAVFSLLKSILLQTSARAPPTSENIDITPPVDNKPNILLVIVPVGSYGLGVWNSSSDIDCLCVGSISTKTFFALASQRLRKAADLGVRILRTVKAASGTMLELDIGGVRLDLQYCPATKVAER